MNAFRHFALPLTLVVSACRFSASQIDERSTPKNASSDANPAETVVSVSVVQDKAQLPSCSETLRGKVFFVSSQGAFQYCDGSIWVSLPGVAGKPGNDGLTMLITSAPEPKGANCAEGGLKLLAGLDQSGDGRLDPAEITASSFLCNGMPGVQGIAGQNGLSSLIAVTPISAGTTCAAGGNSLKIGLDQNRNAVLDANEIQTQVTVCNGTQGAQGIQGIAGQSANSRVLDGAGSEIGLLKFSNNYDRLGTEVPFKGTGDRVVVTLDARSYGPVPPGNRYCRNVQQNSLDIVSNKNGLCSCFYTTSNCSGSCYVVDSVAANGSIGTNLGIVTTTSGGLGIGGVISTSSSSLGLINFAYTKATMPAISQVFAKSHLGHYADGSYSCERISDNALVGSWFTFYDQFAPVIGATISAIRLETVGQIRLPGTSDSIVPPVYVVP